MRSFRLSRALAPVALAALVTACAHEQTNNANAPASSTSATNQTTTTTTTQTTTVQTNSANQSNVAGAPSSPNAADSSASPGAKKPDACQLLTSDDIKSVQGESVSETKPSQSAEGGLSSSQCFFSTATFNKSVSLQLTRAADAQSMRRYWDTLFARAKEEGGKDERDRDKRGRDRDRDKDRDKKKENQKNEPTAGARGEEEEEGAPPTPVKGVGEEAYWATSRFNGILYALKGDSFVRISLGGADKPEERLRKSKILAQKALARL